MALVVCDATDGVTAEDLRIAELAMQSGCATALVLNKWDYHRRTSTSSHERARVNQKLRLRPRVLTAAPRPAATSQRLLVEALGARRPRAHPDPDAGAQPLPGRRRQQAASRRGQAAATG